MTDDDAMRQAKKHADQAWAFTAFQNVMAHRLGNGASRTEIISFLLGTSSAVANLIAASEVESDTKEGTFMQGLFVENMILQKVQAVVQMQATMMAEAKASGPLN